MKCKPLLTLICSLCIIFCTHAQINFEHTDWDSVKEKAKKEKKYILVDAFTTWCGPCKWMTKNVFPQKEVGDFVNEKFVSFKLDMEKGEGLSFAKEYNVRAYPTFVFFNPDGEIVHKKVGSAKGDEFIQYTKEALDPDKQAFTLQKKYNAGEKSPEFLRKYAYALEAAYEDTDQVAEEYLATQTKDSWVEKKNWQFITSFVKDTDSEVFRYVLKNQEKFNKSFNRESMERFVNETVTKAIYPVAKSQDTKRFESLKELYRKLIPDEADKYSAKADYIFYAKSKDSFKYACRYFDEYAQNPNELNRIAWRYFKKENAPEKLKKALEWINKSIELDNNSYNTDTKAHLLYKMKRYAEALKVAEESVILGRKNDTDTVSTEKLIEKIKKDMQ